MYIWCFLAASGISRRSSQQFGHRAGTESGGSKRALLALLRPGGRLGDAGQVIVYATFQKQAAGVAAFLDANGVSAAAYHAGKAPKARSPLYRTLRAHPCTHVNLPAT